MINKQNPESYERFLHEWDCAGEGWDPPSLSASAAVAPHIRIGGMSAIKNGGLASKNGASPTMNGSSPSIADSGVSANNVPSLSASRPYVAIIGGSSLLSSELFSTAAFERREIGTVALAINEETGVVFVQRHAAKVDVSYSPPHAIDHVAIWRVLKELNVSSALGVCSVGTLRPRRVPVGALVVPDDYFAPAPVFPHGGLIHVKSDAHIRPELNLGLVGKIKNVLRRDPVLSARLVERDRDETEIVYGQTLGPRFETRAEVRALARDADVVGMTGGHEAALALEMGISYCMLCVVDNAAHGLDRETADAAISDMEQFRRAQHTNVLLLELAVKQCLSAMLSSFAIPDQIPGLKVDTVIRARYVATVDARDTVFREGGVVAFDANGVIVGVHPADASPRYTARRSLSLPESVLIPGFINAHTHAGMTLLRGFGDDLQLMDWLVTRIWPAEAKFISEDYVRDSTAIAIDEMISTGTTTFCEMYFLPEVTEQVVRRAGMRAVVCDVLIEFPSIMAPGGGDEYMELAAANSLRSPKRDDVSSGLARNPSEDELVTQAIGPHAPYSVNEARLVAAKALATERGLTFTTHCHESFEEVRSSLELDRNSSFCHRSDHAITPLMNMERLSMLDASSLLAHMTQLTEAEIRLLGERGCSVCSCPCSNMKLASGTCPVDKLLKAGVNVALGTDGAASNNCLDMLAEMKTMALVAKGLSKDSSVVSATTVLRVATINGAKALGLQNTCGSIEVGKRADLVAVDLREPIFDPISTLVYATSAKHSVRHVWISGRPKVDEYRLVDPVSPSQEAIRLWVKKIEGVKTELEET